MLTIRVPIASFFTRKESSIAPIKSLSSASGLFPVKIRPDVGTALTASRADEARLKIGSPIASMPPRFSIKKRGINEGAKNGKRKKREVESRS